MSKMSENEIKKAARHCATEELCDGCPLSGYPMSFCAEKFAHYILTDKENEPAPAATETSSEISSNDTSNLTHLDDNTSRRICQAFESADQAVKVILELYHNMSESEQRAFDMGEIYRSMLSATNEMEKLKNGDGE